MSLISKDDLFDKWSVPRRILSVESKFQDDKQGFRGNVSIMEEEVGGYLMFDLRVFGLEPISCYDCYIGNRYVKKLYSDRCGKIFIAFISNILLLQVTDKSPVVTIRKRDTIDCYSTKWGRLYL